VSFSRTISVIAAAILIGLVGVGGAAVGSASPFFSILGSGLLVEMAGIFSGALLGFLFGIPRAVAQSEQVGVPRTDRSNEVNTNLVQISDWLTKILVGVGLVQISTIGPALGRLITAVSEGMKVGLPATGGLVVYSVIVGFLGGYVLTRTILTETFNRYDALTARVEQVEQRAEQAVERTEEAVQRAEEVDSRVSKDQAAVAAADGVLAGAEGAQDEAGLATLFRSASKSALAQVFARANYQRSRNWRTDKAASARTIPVFRALSQVDEAHHYHRNFGELGYALHDQGDWTHAEEALSEAIRIRDSHRIPGFSLYEFVRARCRVALDSSDGRSPEAVRQSILADLRRAATSSVVRRNSLIRETQELADWLKRNGIDEDLS
jgi:hypothetical protein